ncbi:MAG: ferrochelatase [Myxococcota bacterium]
MDASEGKPSAAPRRICVFLLQLGGPGCIEEIEPFLRNLFEDVLPAPRWIRPLLARFVARWRADKIAPLYEALGGGSPLRANTEAQAVALQKRLVADGYDARVLVCMRYAPPRAVTVLEEARRDWSDATWVALPLYPQYSFATTRSSMEELDRLLTTAERSRLVTISAYPDDAAYLDAMAECVREGLGKFTDAQRGGLELVFSAHGLPLHLVRQGDPYPQQIRQTVAGIVARLESPPSHRTAFQSRMGPVKWLEPSTVDTIGELGRAGVENLLVVPVSFVSEHIETLHELDIRLAETARAAGIKRFERAPTPGARRSFVGALAALVAQAVGGDQ